MAQISTARSSMGALMGSVTTAASAVTGVFKVVEDSMSIANNFVSRHAEQQRFANQGDLAMFKREYKDQLAMRDAQRRKSLAEFRNADPLNDELYSDAEKFVEEIYGEKSPT